MRPIQLFATTLLAIAGCQCGAEGPTTQPSVPTIREAPEPEPPPEPEAPPAPPSRFFATPAAGPTEPPTSPQASSFAWAANALGFALFQELRESADGNFAFSPASIAVAFDMLFGGARGETRAEMLSTLHLEDDAEIIHEAAGRVLAQWNTPRREGNTLRVVNRLFGEATFRFEQDYLTLTRSHYRAPLEGVDFLGDAEAQRSRINGWVEEQTEGLIGELLPPQSVTEATRLVLVNAIYFLGRWQNPFDESATADRPFHLADGSAIDVPTMTVEASFRHGRHDGFTTVDLPYLGHAFMMTIIVPDAADGLPELEARLTREGYGGLILTDDGPNLRLHLPRFEVEQRLALAESMKTLGMPLAFDESAADLMGIGTPPEPGQRLYVSEAFHQAYVKTDERGTEAAAATAVVVASGGGPPAPPSELRIDRPFLFVIRESGAGAILFLGRVTDPR